MADKNMIGNRLYYLREKSGLTIKALSIKIKISEGHISEMESGKCMPSMKTLKKICLFYDITLDDFFNKNQVLSNLTVNQQELLALTDGMKDQQIAYLNEFIKMFNKENKK